MCPYNPILHTAIWNPPKCCQQIAGFRVDVCCSGHQTRKSELTGPPDGRKSLAPLRIHRNASIRRSCGAAGSNSRGEFQLSACPCVPRQLQLMLEAFASTSRIIRKPPGISNIEVEEYAKQKSSTQRDTSTNEDSVFQIHLLCGTPCNLDHLPPNRAKPLSSERAFVFEK